MRPYRYIFIYFIILSSIINSSPPASKESSIHIGQSTLVQNVLIYIKTKDEKLLEKICPKKEHIIYFLKNRGTNILDCMTDDEINQFIDETIVLPVRDAKGSLSRIISWAKKNKIKLNNIQISKIYNTEINPPTRGSVRKITGEIVYENIIYELNLWDSIYSGSDWRLCDGFSLKKASSK